jgi:acyl carrier protein phosphodiesterase
MNYLGHAFLSFGDEAILTGNLIGDNVKGMLALEKYPAKIKSGILLHRKIDGFTDVHPATQRAKLMFRATYGLYSGAIMDTLYDHFLANDPKLFPSETALLRFTQQVYTDLDKQAEWFPPKFASYFPYMKEQNWLYNYRTFPGIEQSLRGLARRATNIPSIKPAYEIFITNYYQLNQCYFELIDDLIKFAKSE